MARHAKPHSELDAYFAQVRQSIGLVEAALLKRKAGLGEDGYEMLKEAWERLIQDVQKEPRQMPECAPLPENVKRLYALEADNENDFSPINPTHPSPKSHLVQQLKEFRSVVRCANDPICGIGSPATLEALENDVQEVIMRLMGISKGLKSVDQKSPPQVAVVTR